jgi:serine/threonine-protein kinase
MAAPTLNPGGDLGRFRIVEELGAGGMGIVYRAHDTRLKRDVAIKVLNDSAFSNPVARQRFRSEALILSRLNHPNVECVYEFCSEEEIDFLVLEYVPGRTLSELSRSVPLQENEIISLGIQLARGLAAAHGQRVLHRDLKPGNLRVTPDNVLKILDFGLAQLLVHPEDDTVSDLPQAHGPLAGTPAYLSPEQLSGGEPDTRSDIYAAGMVLYELATGSKPFRQSGQTLVDAILHTPPPSPRLKNKEVSPELDAVIVKCLGKDPRQRYQSARELQIDLERISIDHHPSGPALAFREQAVPQTKKRYVRMAAAAVVVLAVAGILGWKYWGQKPLEQRIMAVLPMDTVGQDPATAALGLGLTETLTAKLAQASDSSAVQIVSPQDLRDQHVKTADDARREFGTDLVFESNLQRSGNIIRVNCYLVDSKTHRQIVTKSIESEITDPFGLQDKVVNATLDMLPKKVNPAERAKLATVQNTQPAAYEAYIRGRGYLQEYQKPESIDSAIREFQKAIAIDPKYALAYAGLGNAYWTSYDRLFKATDAAAQASNYCQHALTLEPELVEAHICMANVFTSTGKDDKAIEEFQKAVAANPQSDDALRGLAKAYKDTGNFPAAEAAYRQLISLRPSSWGGYQSMGLLYYRQARYAEAATMFRKAVEITPDNYHPYTTLGGIYIILGEYQKAIEVFQRSIDLRPNAVAYNNLGYTYYLMHRLPQAVNALQEAVNLNPNNWEFWGNLADAQYRIPWHRAEAKRNYQHTIEMISPRAQLDPKDARTLVYLGGFLAMQGKNQEALQDAQKAVRETPMDPEVLFRAAVVCNQVGKPEQALIYLKKAVEQRYSKPVIRDSPEFQILQGNAEFQALIR